ncbi:Protein CEPU-1 [Cyphomyrmex costatus]|uniref:Protein CEPU-1 n=1 Tax=Cyphomyrmex costatus TaxID=456900 RepID=A0A195CHG2_9HYME|nr:Protein CEPU-1 [Cyphomyrmex costatus]
MAVLPTRWSTSPQPLPPLLIQPSSVSHRSLADLQAPCLISASESRPPDEGYSYDMARERWLHFADLRACVTSCAPFANAMHVTVAWLRVDTQTILTIATHVITKNHRIAVSHSDHRTWFLHIREVRESDRGWYMCQINTDPMKSQIGYLEVKQMQRSLFKYYAYYKVMSYLHTEAGQIRNINVFAFSLEGNHPDETGPTDRLPPSVTDATFDSHVGEPYMPPDILDYDTSTDMVVMEGRNVTLRCAATGSPAPNITWRREDGQQIQLGNGEEVASVDGSSFNITKVNRLHMGSYLCIASNGVPPSVSKRIMLTVHFPPMIWVQNQLVGAQEGQKLTLECYSEAFPKSINYWTRDQDKIVPQGGKYDPVLKDNAYKIHMRLTINSVSPTDYGSYKCVSRNSLGDTDGSIKVYPISGSNSSITKYKGKARHNSGNNNILEGNQDMLKERDLKLRGRKENGGDVADYDESSATSNDSSLLLVILVALCLYLHHHPQMRTLHPA